MVETEAIVRRILIVGLLITLSVVGFFGYQFLKQPSSGVATSEISDRVNEFVAEHEQDQSVISSDSLTYDPAQDSTKQLQTVKTDCFAIKLPVPIAYLKSRSETTENTNNQPKCFVGGLIENPRAQLTISAEYVPELLSLEDHTGVQLRQREQRQYSALQIPVLGGESYRAYEGDTELTAIWLRRPVVYVVSLHSMAKVTESSKKLLSDIISAVEIPELDESASNSVY